MCSAFPRSAIRIHVQISAISWRRSMSTILRCVQPFRGDVQVSAIFSMIWPAILWRFSVSAILLAWIHVPISAILVSRTCSRRGARTHPQADVEDDEPQQANPAAAIAWSTLCIQQRCQSLDSSSLQGKQSASAATDSLRVRGRTPFCACRTGPGGGGGPGEGRPALTIPCT